MSTFRMRHAYAHDRPAGARTCFGCPQPALLLHQLLKPEMRLRGGICLAGIKCSATTARRLLLGTHNRTLYWLVIRQRPSCCHRFFSFASVYPLMGTEYTYQSIPDEIRPASRPGLGTQCRVNSAPVAWDVLIGSILPASLLGQTRQFVRIGGVGSDTKPIANSSSESLGKGQSYGHENGAAAPKLQVDRLAVCREKRDASLCSYVPHSSSSHGQDGIEPAQ
ncbi:hypothetical protein J3F83DRAFT_78441 [Trichoderma novae-zelandiae]